MSFLDIPHRWVLNFFRIGLEGFGGLMSREYETSSFYDKILMDKNQNIIS